MGYRSTCPIAARYRVPIVVTGFEPLDLLQGIHMCLRQLEEGRAEVENQYAPGRDRGGQPAGAVAGRPRCSKWWTARGAGVGEIPRSGLGLRPDYREFDAERRFDLSAVGPRPEPAECMSGLVLAGPDQAARVRGVRHPLHTRAPAGRDDGVVRGRLRRLLSSPAVLVQVLSARCGGLDATVRLSTPLPRTGHLHRSLAPRTAPGTQHCTEHFS